MTGPVARGGYPRRTVAVAVALVVSQTALCAIIGWLTFGPPPAGSQSPDPVDPEAAPAIVMPTVSVGLPPTSAPPTSAPPTRRSAKPVESSTAEFRREPRPPAPLRKPETRPATREPQPSTVVAPEESPSPLVAPNPGTAPSPADSEEVQGPVEVGQPCDPPGAFGVTADDVSLLCVLQEDGAVVWQIN